MTIYLSHLTSERERMVICSLSLNIVVEENKERPYELEKKRQHLAGFHAGLWAVVFFRPQGFKTPEYYAVLN